MIRDMNIVDGVLKLKKDDGEISRPHSCWSYCLDNINGSVELQRIIRGYEGEIAELTPLLHLGDDDLVADDWVWSTIY